MSPRRAQLCRGGLPSDTDPDTKAKPDYADGVGGPAVCTLRLETVTSVPKSGPIQGKIVSYKKPTLKVNGPCEGASEPA